MWESCSLKRSSYEYSPSLKNESVIGKPGEPGGEPTSIDQLSP